MSDDITTNAINPDMTADDAATQQIHAQLLALGNQWRDRHVPTDRLARHISALATHEQHSLPTHSYPLQQEEFVLTDTPSPQRRSMPQRRYVISAVAAVVVIALLGAAFLAVVRRAPGTHLPTATMALPSATMDFTKVTTQSLTATISAPTTPHLLRSLHMIDATTGWAQTDQKILRTTDGALHWQDVTPQGITFPLAPPHALISTARDAATAWASDGTTIYRTTNGGQTWQAAQPQVEKNIDYLTFVDGQHGWAVDFLGFAASHSYLNLLHTRDGGATWARVTTTDGPGGLPSAGDKSLPAFNSPSTGWIGGSEPAPNVTYLYVTHDGGATWQQQTLPRPMSPDFYSDTSAPTFFDANNGVLSLNVSSSSGGASRVFIYVTHNGGASWSIGPSSQGALDFLDMSHWWGIAGSNGNDLTFTGDGGQHWTTITPGGAFNNIGELDFVSSAIGWASTRSDSSQPTTLLHTSDGGHTWQQIDYQVG